MDHKNPFSKLLYGMDHLNGDKCFWSHFHFFTKVFYKFLGSSQTWPSLAGHPLTNKSMKCCQKTSGLIRKYIFLWKLISLLSIWINLQWSPLDCSNFSIYQFTKFGDKITKNGHKITVTFRWPIPIRIILGFTQFTFLNRLFRIFNEVDGHWYGGLILE